MCKYTAYLAHIVHIVHIVQRVLKGPLLTSALCIVPDLCKQGCPTLNTVVSAGDWFCFDVYTMYIAHIVCSAGF